MQKISSKVDKQATSLLDIMFWSNIVVIALLAVINAINLVRAGSGGEPLVKLASPEIIALASALLVCYLAYGCVRTMLTRIRLNRVSVVLTESGVEGVSLPEPMTSKKGKRFSTTFEEITEVSTVLVSISKKHETPSLKIGCGESIYIVPAPENLREIIAAVSDRMHPPMK